MPGLVLLCVCAAGALLARRLDPTSTRVLETLALGSAIGLATFAGFGLLLGWVLGLSAATVVASALLTLVVSVGFGARPAEIVALARTTKRPTRAALILCGFIGLLVVRLADRTLFETAAGGIATGDRHNYGDLPFHMSIAAGFAYGDNFPPAHPELAGTPLTYPFFCDLISGMILAAGGSWRDAFFWPTLILGLGVVVALSRFGEALSGSRVLGRVSAALTLLSGGLGVFRLASASAIQEWWQHGPDLTINDAGIRYGNFILTLFIPQRSILFGWPLLFFALALLIEGQKADPTTNDGKAARTQAWLRAGILVSFLPLVHSHSFAVAGLCALIFAARAGSLQFPVAFARGVTPLALPALIFMVSRNSLSTSEFFAWKPGFDGGHDDPLRYWLMNAGVFLPLVLLGLFRAGAGAREARVNATPFAFLFLVANLFRLAPWIWDNMKFLAPAHAGLAPFAAMALASIWRSGRLGRIAAVLAFGVATVSGALDVAKVLLSGGEFGIFDRTGMEYAEKVRQATPPDTTILTAPSHNHPVLLSGRRVFLGYEGHLWSQGLDYTARQNVAAAVFRGDPQPHVSGLALVRIQAIALTPAEEPLVTNRQAVEGLPSLVDSPYRLVTVR